MLMGNNYVCKAIGIGSIHIKMDDGVMRTLTDVRHIPALKRNLLSLGALDSNGYKFVGEGGVLKVTRGSLVMMKGKINKNLYTLMGETVLGSGAVGDSTAESNKTQLWHMRLGHMTEKGLMILGRLGVLKGMKNHP